MHISKDIYSISIVNIQECAQIRIVKVFVISKLIQHIVIFVVRVFAQFVLINFMKETVIKMA